jgi:hypothetical protein
MVELNVQRNRKPPMISLIILVISSRIYSTPALHFQCHMPPPPLCTTMERLVVTVRRTTLSSKQAQQGEPRRRLTSCQWAGGGRESQRTRQVGWRGRDAVRWEIDAVEPEATPLENLTKKLGNLTTGLRLYGCDQTGLAHG